MIATLFTTDIVKGGLLSCAIGGGVAAGQFSAALWATPGGMFRWKLFFSVICCTAFTAGLAGAKTQATASALAVMSAYFIGALESLAGVALTLVIKDQTEIGVAVGVYGSIRSVGGALASEYPHNPVLMDPCRMLTASVSRYSCYSPYGPGQTLHCPPDCPGAGRRRPS